MENQNPKEIKSRIGELVWMISRAKSRGAILKGNSVFEKELNSIINAPEVKIELTPEQKEDNIPVCQ